MLDEHTRGSLLDLVECSITAERLVDELEKVFAVTGGLQPGLDRSWTPCRRSAAATVVRETP